MPRARLYRPQYRLRLWTVVVGFAACALVSAPVAAQTTDDAMTPGYDSSDPGVTSTFASDLSAGSDGTVLSEVLVDPMVTHLHHPESQCRRCESRGDLLASSEGGLWNPTSGCSCDCRYRDSLVRDELAARRKIEHCTGFRSRLRFRAAAVYMDRVTDNYRTLIESTSDPIRQLNAEKFDFDWEPGIDVSVSQVLWDDSAFEFRFLGLQEFEATQHVDTQGSDVRFDADPDVFAPNVQTIDSRYTSDLYGFELNWHYVTYCPFNYIAGFRYIALDDDLTAVLDAGPQTFRYRTSTRNDLYGVQLGVTSVPEMPLLGWHCLSWFAKAGIYGNDTSQQTVLDTTVLGQIVSESPDTSAVLWEFGLGLDLPVTDCVSIQGGYSAMIFERISIASDQLRHIDFLDATGFSNRGTAMFHGANLAIVLRH